MKLHGDITINNRLYRAGTDVPWFAIYPFFLLHMAVFGLSGFFMAYGSERPPTLFLYLHGGLAIAIYTVFYITIFGFDEVKWMAINAVLGVVGIYSQIGWLLARFGKTIDDYRWYINAIPFAYFVLYTFLLRHAVIDLTGSREDPQRRRGANAAYVALSLAVCLASWLAGRHR
ncbi:MAG TPA: hypothetical protein VGH80_06050 [Xanthomonadaceae bacterium]